MPLPAGRQGQVRRTSSDKRLQAASRRASHLNAILAQEYESRL